MEQLLSEFVIKPQILLFVEFQTAMVKIGQSLGISGHLQPEGEFILCHLDNELTPSTPACIERLFLTNKYPV